MEYLNLIFFELNLRKAIQFRRKLDIFHVISAQGAKENLKSFDFSPKKSWFFRPTIKSPPQNIKPPLRSLILRPKCKDGGRLTKTWEVYKSVLHKAVWSSVRCKCGILCFRQRGRGWPVEGQHHAAPLKTEVLANVVQITPVTRRVGGCQASHPPMDPNL